MSYCRFGEDGSSIYMIGTSQGVECIMCRLAELNTMGFHESHVSISTIEALEHALDHIKHGETVPLYVIIRLAVEAEGQLGKEYYDRAGA